MRHFLSAMCVLGVVSWTGCGGKAPLHGPAVPPPEQTQSSNKNAALRHVEGLWENPGKGGRPRQLIFAPGGQLTFQGGLEFYNPARWDLDPARHELKITLPQADVDKLQVFQLYLHDGVKAFDPGHKQITYDFNEETWTLNVAGWMYSKASKPELETVPEPVLK